MINIGIFLFNEIEVLDFAGPFEVFSITTDNNGNKAFNVYTITEKERQIQARNGLKVVSDYTFKNTPDLNILIIPGGYGAEEIEIHNKVVIEWIKVQYEKVDILASVCTGAFLLAKAELLNNKRATTHWMDIDRLKKEFPLISVEENIKFIEQGDIITSGGISAGINMSFNIVKNLLGEEVAKQTARRMEYDIEI